tara:strand:- start:375 stop:710 length:336 start_codon:yes stop_codon:yes gene_type:complete
MKKIKLGEICCTRSGDKGSDTNVGVIFYNSRAFNWAERELTALLVKSFFKSVVKGDVVRYSLPNLYSFNFILKDSLGGGGSDTLINDAQGKTHGQALMYMEVVVPEDILDD